MWRSRNCDSRSWQGREVEENEAVDSTRTHPSRLQNGRAAAPGIDDNIHITTERRTTRFKDTAGWQWIIQNYTGIGNRTYCLLVNMNDKTLQGFRKTRGSGVSPRSSTKGGVESSSDFYPVPHSHLMGMMLALLATRAQHRPRRN